MGRQRGGNWDGAKKPGWVEGTEEAKALWDKRSSLPGVVKETKHKKKKQTVKQTLQITHLQYSEETTSSVQIWQGIYFMLLLCH